MGLQYNIKKLLYQLGFGNVWTEQDVGNEDFFMIMFSQRALGVSTQNLHSDTNNSSKLRTYSHFQSVLEEDNYLSNLDIFKFRKALTNFRISCHSLATVETGRYDYAPIHERICHFCLQRNTFLIDDEYHLIMECGQVNNIRHIYISVTITKYVHIIYNLHIICGLDKNI